MPPAGARGAVWQAIRQGQAPSDPVLDGIVADVAPVLGREGTLALRSRLRDASLGLGPLADLVADPAVTDVLVNGPHGVWVDRGAGLSRCAAGFTDEDAVRRYAVRLAALAGQRLDDSSPFVDGLLPGGVRLHAVLPPLVDGGAHVSLRVPRRSSPDLDTLCAWGMLGPELVDLLRALVRSRRSFLVTGGTGAGKTTLLAALLGEVDPQERLVVVEDVREMSLTHPHVVRLQGRAANVEGSGSVPLTQLVRQSLRMRPDRLVVGEVRGPEVRDLLTALNTGHDGGCGTLHANTCADVVSRVEALGALAGLSPAAVHAQLASAVEVVVHTHRPPGQQRRVQELAVLLRSGHDGRVEAVGAWREGHPGPAAADLSAALGWPT